MSSEAPALKVRDIFKNRNFRLLWLAQCISRFGDSLTSLALLILINKLTGSTVALATLAIVLILPQITFGLIAGVYVDRLDRRRIMIVSDTVRGIMVLGFMLVGTAGQIWLIYVIGLLQATIGAFFNPALGATLPNIVPKAELLAANSVMQVSRLICLTLGTSAAGLIIGVFGAYWPAFMLDALTFFIAPWLVSRLLIPAQARTVSYERSVKAIFGELKAGLKLVFGTRILVGTLVGVGVAVLGQRAFDVLIVPFLDRDLHTSATWLGAVYGAQTLSTLLSGGVIALIAVRLKPTQILSYGLLILGIFTCTLLFITQAWHLFLLAVSFGLIAAPINAAIATIIQTSVTDEVRGRVGASFETLISVASLTSLTLSGILGDLISIRNVFFLAGIITITSGLVSAWMFAERPKSKKLEVVKAQGEV